MKWIIEKKFFFVTVAILPLVTNSQETYRYSVDLNKVENDMLSVELLCPKVAESQTTFYLPRIVPGTYMNSNYGKYVHDLVAMDKAGKSLPVKKKGDNRWEIKNARSLHRITYKVEDTWDSEIKNRVYSMCGTNFEAGKNFVINTPGMFGYLEGMKKNGFELTFTKPEGFYGATGLKPVSASASSEVYRCSTAEELYDSPFMFSVPDTTSIRVGNADVLIAVYSPKKQATSKFIAANLEKLLIGTKDYLGGKLPVDKYAFIYYFNGEQKKMPETGAWEHSYSSFYSLDEQPQEEAIDGWVDVSAHEFFHIVTPLTISSREVKEFNFNETNLSKHVWLYEGSTEYDAHYMQVWAGFRTPAQFLATLSQKINISRTYFNDSLSFTELSKRSADKWKEQYVNVYMKGALISACLDIYLLKLSGGQYSLRNLKHDLGIRYGKDNYFEDAVLFDEIEKLSFAGVKDFLVKYVEGSKPIPYGEYFSMAGIQYIPKEKSMVISLGCSLIQGEKGTLVVSEKGINEFGKKLGYQAGDELLAVNGQAIDLSNVEEVLEKFVAQTQEGDRVEVKVNRTSSAGAAAAMTLSAPAQKIEREQLHILRIDKKASPEQVLVRNAWLHVSCR